MTKKKKKILTAIIIIAVLSIAIAVYAKYFYDYELVGNGKIAKWSFKVNKSTNETQSISLKSTFDNETLVNNKIAPGTQGSFQIEIESNSEVGTNYSLSFTDEINKPENLYFEYIDSGNVKHTYKNLAELNNELSSNFIDANSEKKVTLNINWIWPYETDSDNDGVIDGDEDDTRVSMLNDDYTFNVSVQANQVLEQE